VPTELSRLRRRDYWLLFPTPVADTHRAAVYARAREHMRWPQPAAVRSPARPSHETTAIRAADEDAARLIAARSPLVLADLLTFSGRQWRLNEGSIAIRISRGTATHDWR
jgi:hypothetical protein